MTKDQLERHQVWLYLCAILVGLMLGSAFPALAPAFEALLWPALAALLYTTFTQIRLIDLPTAFSDIRFVCAALIGNFLLLPLLVFAVLMLAPDDPAILLGLVLVLLVPCTDWFISFVHQAGGDLKSAIAITPALLIAQMLMLPLYLYLFMGSDFAESVAAENMLIVFAVIIVLPIAAALATERWAGRNPSRLDRVQTLGWLPVPLLALVLFLIAAAQVDAALSAIPVLGDIALACLAFLIGATACGLVLARVFKLPVAQARTLVFTLTTRNSFVVLPFALALPAAWELAAMVIVFQSLIELFAMLALLWLVPRKLLPGR